MLLKPRLQILDQVVLAEKATEHVRWRNTWLTRKSCWTACYSVAFNRKLHDETRPLDRIYGIEPESNRIGGIALYLRLPVRTLNSTFESALSSGFMSSIAGSAHLQLYLMVIILACHTQVQLGLVMAYPTRLGHHHLLRLIRLLACLFQALLHAFDRAIGEHQPHALPIDRATDHALGTTFLDALGEQPPRLVAFVLEHTDLVQVDCGLRDTDTHREMMTAGIFT